MTFRTQPFKPDLLVVKDKAVVGAFGHRQRDIGQAVSITAVGAGEVRVALFLGAVVGQFIMPGSITDKGSVYEALIE